MKKVLSAVAVSVLATGGLLANPSVADDRPAFDVCSNEITSNCIQSFSIDGPGTSGTVALSKESYSSSGIVFDTTGTGFTPSQGSRRLKLLVNNMTSPVLPGIEGGVTLGQITISDPEASDASNPRIDPDTSYTVSIVSSTKFPPGAIAQLSGGSYSVDVQNGNYVFTVKAKPVRVIASASVSGYPAVFPNVATSERHGIFSMTFVPAVSFPFKYQGMPASSDRAWLVVETNAAQVQSPSFGNDTLSIGLGAPHLLMDGSTLNTGEYRLVMTDEMVTDIYGMSVAQAIGGGLVAQTSENGGPLGSVNATVGWTADAVKGSMDQFVEFKLRDFHYSSQDVKVKPSTSLKSSNITWSGKKSSIKKKALTVKAAVKSNKKKVAGSLKVELLNSAGTPVEQLTASVKKGTGKVIFNKATISALPKGNYSVRMTYYGSGTAKNVTRTYSLKIK